MVQKSSISKFCSTNEDLCRRHESQCQRRCHPSPHELIEAQPQARCRRVGECSKDALKDPSSVDASAQEALALWLKPSVTALASSGSAGLITAVRHSGSPRSAKKIDRWRTKELKNACHPTCSPADMRYCSRTISPIDRRNARSRAIAPLAATCRLHHRNNARRRVGSVQGRRMHKGKEAHLRALWKDARRRPGV